MKIDVNGTRLNVLEAGSKHSISPITFVFLHYFGGSAQEWLTVMERLVARQGTHCLAIDLRGFGDSDATPTGYSVDDMADDVAGVIDHFGLTGHTNQVPVDDNFILVGHSMSGKVALALAARRLPGLRSLVLFAPSPPSPEPIADDTRQQMLATHGQRAAARQTLDTITVAPLSEAVQEQIIADNLRSAPAAWQAWMTTGSREDITDRMARLNTRIYVAVGDNDAAVPLRVQQTAVMPWLPADATLQIIPGVGHLSPYEAPDAVVTILEAALAEEPFRL